MHYLAVANIMNIAGQPFPPNTDFRKLETARLVEQFRASQGGSAVRRAGCETWSCTWSPDSAYFAWSCGNCLVKLIAWDRYRHCTLSQDDAGADGQPGHHPVTIDAGELVWALAFGSSAPHTTPHSPCLNWSQHGVLDDLVLATGLQSGTIRTWNVQTGEPLQSLSDHSDVIRDLSYAPDGSMRLLSASRDGCIKVWASPRNVTLAGGESIHVCTTLRGASKWVYACCWSPNCTMLAAVGDSREVLLWDGVTYRHLCSLSDHHHDVCSCDFSPDGALLATSSYDTRVLIWDPYLGIVLMQLLHLHPPPSPTQPNESYVRGVSFCHDGRHVATVCDDRYTRFWDVYSTDVPLQTAVVVNALCCRYSPDGAVLAVGTRNGSVTLWLAPMQVCSLQHLCRMAIRFLLPSDKVDSLVMPLKLRRFLRYEIHW